MKRKIVLFALLAVALGAVAAGSLWFRTPPLSGKRLADRYAVAVALGMRDRVPTEDASDSLMRAELLGKWEKALRDCDAYCRRLCAASPKDQEGAALLKAALDDPASQVIPLSDRVRAWRLRELLPQTWSGKELRTFQHELDAGLAISDVPESKIREERRDAINACRYVNWHDWWYARMAGFARSTRKIDFSHARLTGSCGNPFVYAQHKYSEEIRRLREERRKSRSDLRSQDRDYIRHNPFFARMLPYFNFNPLLAQACPVKVISPSGTQVFWVVDINPLWSEGKPGAVHAGVLTDRKEVAAFVREAVATNFKYKVDTYRYHSKKRK